ncbi:hypothetical protein RDWZM_007607, partial [Blomia tropicalis]
KKLEHRDSRLEIDGGYQMIAKMGKFIKRSANNSTVGMISTTYHSGASTSAVAPISTTYRSGSQSTCPSNSGAQSAMVPI